MPDTFLKIRYWALTALFMLAALPALYGQANLTVAETADTGGTASTVTAVGQTIGFYMTVASNGSVNATNVAMSDPLPNPNGAGSGVNWFIDVTTGGPSCSISGSAPYQTLNCSLAVLAPGNNFSVHVKSATTTASGGVYQNCATASADGVSPVQTCNAISVIGACSLNYPNGTAPALSSVVFNESVDLVASAACNASGCGEPVAGPNDWVALFYTDEHAMTLGIRQVAVKTSAGTTTTNYSITPLSGNPGTATNPSVGTTMLGNNLFFPNTSGHNPQGNPNDQAGTDTATWSSTYFYLDSGRPMWPALLVTDITGNPSSFSGDYQQGATAALPPNAIYGTWKAAVRTVDHTKSPYTITVTPDSDPAQNGWNLGPGSDIPPGGFSQYASQGWGTEVKWNINQVTINGQPLTAGHAYRMQIMVHDGDQNQSGGDTGESCTNVVVPGMAGLTLFCPANTGLLGVPYSSEFVATGGTQPYSFAITGGALPPGLSLNVATGAVTGTPSATGTFSFTAQVVDFLGNIATVSCSITITAPQPLHLTCPPVTSGTVGTPYSSSLSATGGVPPYAFSISAGSLPPGLSLNPSSGAITGTPTTAGNYHFTAKVVDSRGTSVTVNCSITIAAAPALQLACPPTGKGHEAHLGQFWSGSFTASGGVPPYTFSISAGSLPPGLTLDPSSGLVSGVPTTAGNFSFTGKVVDSFGNSLTVSCSINIGPPPPISLLCPTGAGNLTVGQPYSGSLTVSGGTAPYTFSIVSGSLPPGLTLNSSTGVISGTPTTPGTYTYIAQVTDSSSGPGGPKTAAVSCSLTVNAPPLSLQCPPATTGTVGQPYSSSLTATGGVQPYTFSISVGTLPPGLSLNASTGAITGTPTTPGTYSFTAKVVDSAGSSTTASCSITIAAPALSLQCPPVTTGTVGQPYSSSLTATGGVQPYTFSISVGTLPPGLSLDASTGAITGTPTTPGTYSFTAKVVDSAGSNTTANCSITIAPSALSLLCPSGGTNLTQGQPYSGSLTASGGTTPYTFSITSGSLPPGLTLDSSTGVISGTPTTPGTYNYTAKVVDSGGQNATVNCSFSVASSGPNLSCNPTSSLSVLLQGMNVTAYIPNGSWMSPNPGVQVVPLEPTGTPASIGTSDVVNSCASNSTTGQTVCTANGTDVYLISGSTLSATLTSGSDGPGPDFSGGNCYNCGVVINPTTNMAAIEMGLVNSPSHSGIQFLDLNTSTFFTPIPTINEISEDVLWDTQRNLILSPNEDNIYDLLQVQGTSVTEFANPINGLPTGFQPPEMDSAGEDCGTGIALAGTEFSNGLLLADLTQATFAPGTPGSWSSPGTTILTIPEFAPYEASESGTDGIAVAPGTHLGLVIGEFPTPPNANAVLVVNLPATAGSGSPALQDYVVATLPADPDGSDFAMGCDPHTVAAYVSPSSNKAIGLVPDFGFLRCDQGGTPQYVALIDLQGLLNAPRVSGMNLVDPNYDLIAHGIVTFIPAH